MLSIGIDPGTASVGWGLVQERPDGSLVSPGHGVITTEAGQPMHLRLQRIHEELEEIIGAWRPERAGVEEMFFARNVTTAITVAQGRGVILLTLATAGLPVYEYKPNMVKQAIAGYGAAGKTQMQEMVRILLGMEDRPRPDDAADALAVAITDLHSAGFRKLQDART
ncbi:MAG: crossover junction endodeoxyribonuclease RuvC [Anaerolineaceae bacterium]|nr:crossover junction endodeoxyribonuclease RuvC [Anaerolineaceae bacterium]